MKHLIPYLFLFFYLPLVAQQPSAADRAGILAHFKQEMGDAYPEGLDPIEIHGIDFDGDGEAEWVAIFNGWATSLGYVFDTGPLRALPGRVGVPVSRPGVDMELEVVDVDQDGREEALFFSGGGGTFSHDLKADLLALEGDSLYAMWHGRISSVNREEGIDMLNALRFERDKEGRIRRIELMPASAAVGDSAYNRHAVVKSEFPRFQWDWVDSTRSFHPRIVTVYLEEPGKGKYLKLETMDVVFYLPYDKGFEREIMGDDFGDWMRAWPVLWPKEERDAAWSQFLEVKERIQKEMQVDVTGYREFSLLMGYFLERGLTDGTVSVFDKASNVFLRDIRHHSYPQFFNCECPEGNVVKGSTWKVSFYAHTPYTTFLYFYSRQTGTSHECCMEEWPFEDD